MNSCMHFKDVKNIQKPHSCKATPLEKDTSETIAT